MDDRQEIGNRWKSDEEQGGAVVYRCHMCKNRQNGLGCSVFGTIPDEIAAAQKTCPEFIQGDVDFTKITF